MRVLLLNDFLHILVGVDLGGRVGAKFGELWSLAYLQWKAVRVRDVPMEGVQLNHSHAI